MVVVVPPMKPLRRLPMVDEPVDRDEEEEGVQGRSMSRQDEDVVVVPVAVAEDSSAHGPGVAAEGVVAVKSWGNDTWRRMRSRSSAVLVVDEDEDDRQAVALATGAAPAVVLNQLTLDVMPA